MAKVKNETTMLDETISLKQEQDYQRHTVKLETEDDDELDVKELNSHTQNHFPLIKQEYLQPCMLDGDNCSELTEHGGQGQSDVLPEYDNKKGNTMVNINSGTSVSEMIRDIKRNSRMNENRAALDSAGCCESIRNHSENQTDCQPILQNEDCLPESSNMFSSINDKNADPHTVDVSDRLHSNIVIQTQHSHLVKQTITHNKEKSFKCDFCDAGFARKNDLIIHRRRHTGEKPHKCDDCGAGFAVKSYLAIHKRIHTGEKPYKCDMCSAEFAAKSSLNTHQKTHTGEKSYTCDVCNIGFAENSTLRTHRRIHTGEKPFMCDYCGTGFAQHCNLKTHKRKHTGEKPYKCDVCETAFAHKSHLVAHKTKHTGEKPYKCDVCEARFANSSSLGKHKRRHTG